MKKYRDRVPSRYGSDGENGDGDEKDITKIINVNTPSLVLLSIFEKSSVDALL